MSFNLAIIPPSARHGVRMCPGRACALAAPLPSLCTPRSRTLLLAPSPSHQNSIDEIRTRQRERTPPEKHPGENL